MASKDVFEKILNGIGLDSGAEDEDYEGEDFDDGDDYGDLDNRSKDRDRDRAPRRAKQKFAPVRRTTSNRGERVDEMYNIHRMHAKTIDDGKQITELLKNRTTVIINLEGVDLAIAQRIIDYTSGSCFALDAKLESISSYIFMASPSSANVTADITGENVSSIDVPGTDGSDYL